MRIVALRVKDFKRIKDIAIDADRGVIILGGKNGQGKSSALDAVTAALMGSAAAPERPVRDGAERGEVEVTFDGGIVVKRTFTPGGGSLTIKTADGMSPSKPQAWLDARIGDLSCDPLAFMAAKPKEQADTLRRIAGVDTSEIDARRAGLYEERRDIGRDGEREAGALATMPEHADAPDEEVTPQQESAADIASELDAASETERAAQRADAAVAVAEHDRMVADETAETAGSDLEQARENLRRAEARLAKAQEARDVAARNVDQASQVAALAHDAVTDPAPIRARLADVERKNAEARREADAINQRVRAKKARAERAAVVARLRADYKAKSDAIAALDAERAKMLASAAYPVTGLGFDADGGVTFGGLPLSQASGAEKIRVSMAVALSARKDVRVVLIRDASLLDDDGLALVAKMAEERDAQVWLERVGDKDPGAVVFVDGEVKS